MTSIAQIPNRVEETLSPGLSSPIEPSNSPVNMDPNNSIEGEIQSMFRSSLQDRRMITSSPSIEDVSRLRVENSQVRTQLHQAHMDFQTEQDSVIQLKKRLNNIEKDRLMATTRSNNEITSRDSEITKLRAELEKGEATRQNLEFELAKMRRDMNNVKKNSLEQSKSITETSDQMREKIAMLSEETAKLQQQIRDEERSSDFSEKRLKAEVEEKEELLAKTQTEREILRADRDRLELLLRENNQAITELSERLQDADTERQNNIGMLRRTTTEMDYAKERGEHIKKELDIAVKKVKSLEEVIEGERASHLESKFNSEIIQLRVRDLEGAVEVERGAQFESNKTVESLANQLRQLQHTYEEQKKLLKEGREKHDKLLKNHDSVRYQLTAEVDDKKTVIQNLSKQLEIHQINFNELKDELSKARKRQIYLEQTYGSNMREMELLVTNFQIEDSITKKKKLKKSDGKRDVAKSKSSSGVLETLRNTLLIYRKQLDKTTEELKKAKSQCDKLNKDNSSLKDSIQSKDKAIEDTQKNFAKSSRELIRVRSDYSDLETLLARMKLDLQCSSDNRDKDTYRVQEVSEELVKLTQKHRAENEEKMSFIHSLYQQLLSGRMQPSFTEKPFPNFTWQDMTPLIQEEILSLLQQTILHRQQVLQLEETLQTKEELLMSLEREHTQQVYQLNAINTDREQGWCKQKEELEMHYNLLIQDIQNRSKKSQVIADQAWEKVRMSGSVRQGLETECVELRTRLVQTQQDNNGLQIAVSLLCGALYPLYARANSLAAERRILEEELFNFDSFKGQVQEIVNAMSAEFGETKIVKKSSNYLRQCGMKRHPLLTFRIGVVAVMAANRLKHLANSSSKMFVTYDTISGNHGLMVCTGGVQSQQPPFTGVGMSILGDTEGSGENRSIMDWLTSSDLFSTVLASTTDLQDVISQIKDSVNVVESRALTGAARTCFTRLLDRLMPYFEGITLHPVAGLRDKQSLIRRLGKGLHNNLQKLTLEQRTYMIPYQETVTNLQRHLLQLTERLHKLEVERRDLLVENGSLRQDTDELTACKQHLVYLEDEVQAYREHSAEDTVPLARFETVCSELDGALSREHQAQALLQEQSRQLEEFSTRLHEGATKQNRLTETVQDLSEKKADLKVKEQSLRQLNKTISQLEIEKKGFQGNLYDAENALRTAAKDKDILATYITTVESAVNQVKSKLSAKEHVEEVSQLPKLLLNVDFIPSDIGKAGPELIACQNLVGEFVDTLAQMLNRVKAVETENISHQQHISTLKTELSAVVRREAQDQEDYPVRDVMGITRVDSQDSINKDNYFKLQEDSELSYSLSPSPKSKSWKSKTPLYQTPRRSVRTKPGSTALK